MTALSSLPKEADEIPKSDFQSIFRKENDYLKSALEMIPVYKTSEIVGSTDYMLSGTATVTMYISRVGELGTQDAKSFANTNMSSYQQIQESHSRSAKVRKLVEQLDDPGILKRFDVACEAYIGVKSGTVNRTAAGAEMRSLLSGVKMGLFNKARKQPKENMTWTRMTNRLSKGEYEETLLNQKENIHSLLMSDLTHIFKGEDLKSPINLDHKWSQVLDHIYLVISLTKIPSNH